MRSVIELQPPYVDLVPRMFLIPLTLLAVALLAPAAASAHRLDPVAAERNHAPRPSDPPVSRGMSENFGPYAEGSGISDLLHWNPLLPTTKTQLTASLLLIALVLSFTGGGFLWITCGVAAGAIVSGS
jgi:hypothetical protein